MTGRSITATPPVSLAAGRETALRFDYQTLVNVVFALFVFSGSIVSVEPSPYDLMFFLAAPVWFLGGFTIHRSFLIPAFLILARVTVSMIALVPYWSKPDWTSNDPTTFEYLSAYMAGTALFYALFFANRTEQRVTLCLNAYTAGALLASILAIVGYFNIAGLGEAFTRYGRGTGSFKDPNVYGSFAFVGAIYLAQNIMLARARSFILSAAATVIIVAGVFLSFSRGSWGAMVLSLTLMAASGYLTMEDPSRKRRIAFGALAAVAIIAVALVLLLSFEDTREFFLQRFSVTQEYDEGATGRFGNQWRSLPLIFGDFWGMGPMQFPKLFTIEPHNTYLGAFANDGWIAGLLFIALTGVTIFVAVRLMFAPSPFRQLAQVASPALLALFMQCFQIDIDHWRHFYLLLGAVWGMEAARQKWQSRGGESADG